MTIIRKGLYDQLAQGYNEAVEGAGIKDTFDLLEVGDFEVLGSGYVLVYVSNEGSLIDCVFDGLEVRVNKHPVVQSEDYYPFGLTFNSFQRVTAKENRWKFQGQERVDDLGLGWDMFLFRMHDPSIGRFLQTDPLAEDYYYNSPYAFAENKVISYFELEGLEAGWAGSGHGFNLTNSQEFKNCPGKKKSDRSRLQVRPLSLLLGRLLMRYRL